jgi:hypothetical protein
MKAKMYWEEKRDLLRKIENATTLEDIKKILSEIMELIPEIIEED